MHVENITSNAMSLDRNGQSMLIQVYEKEIDRLNNIIDELEKYIKTEAKIELYKDKNGFRTFADSDDILNKLKELKEDKC